MSERKRIYKDSDGVRRILHWDDEDDSKFHIETVQDMEPILESAAARRDNHDPRKDMWGVGMVPVAVWERSVHERWEERDWKKWWNGDGKPFRTSPGRV